jgi:CubicO group peptidase (beta-lactamase class C family)
MTRLSVALVTLSAFLTVTVAVRADAIDDLVRDEMKRQKIPGLSLAVVHRGKVVKAAGYGVANLEHDVPAKRETVFQSGSVGKMFTSALIMQLVEDGKLKLDEPVGTYLPDAPESWRGVTVRHLLTHTGGIKEYTAAVNLQQDYTEDQLLRKAFEFKPRFKPGEKWEYSNTGYAVLGILASKVGGKFYGDQLKERVFDPLGMRTARIISEADVVPNRAAGYRLAKGVWKNQGWVAPTLNTTGDGALYLTVDDFIKWDAALGTDKLLKKASWEQIWTPAKLNDGKEAGYGFGWSLGERNGHQRTHHGGAWQGFTSYFDRYPDDQLTVVVLTNLAAPLANPGRIAVGVAELQVPDLKEKR